MSVIKLSCFNTHTTGCTNDFVTVNIDPSASIPTCLFQNSWNTTIITCSVQYIAYVIKNKYLIPMEIVHFSIILIKRLYNLPCPVPVVLFVILAAIVITDQHHFGNNALSGSNNKTEI